MTVNKKKLAAAIALISAGGQAYAQEQQILLRVELEQVQGSDYRASVYYRPSDGVGTTGIGLRLHYDSSLLNFVDSTLQVTNDLIATQQLADTSDEDSVPSTNQMFTAAWTSLGGSWPSATVNGEVLLFTSNFQLNDTSSPNDILLNLTTSSLPAGYGLAATNFSSRLPDIHVAPEGADKTITIPEDGSHTLTAADFGFSDPNDNPANAFVAVKIASLPATGSLQLNGADVSVDQEIAVADFPNLVFTPAANQHVSPYSTFTFQVKDDGAASKTGSIDLDPTPNTITFNVTPVNDAPTATDRGISILEGGSFTFSAESFGFLDASDSPPDALDAVIVESVPGVGSLTLSGAAVTGGQVVPAAQIANLVYTPNVAPGANVSTLSFKVRDDGGTANGGQNESIAANTLTFSVTNINSAPSGADKTLSVFQNDTLTFSVADFGFSDAEDVPSNNLRAVIFDTVPAKGAFTLNGVAVTAGQSVLAANVSSLTFTPATDESGAAYASFTFRVQDDGGTEDGGVDIGPITRTLTVNVQPVNSAPASEDKTVSTLEDISYSFSTDDFVLTDSNDSPANTLAAVKIESLPANGSLTLNANPVSVGDSISVADIANLEFTPAANQFGDGHASFTFRVQDDGGTANGGVDLASAANTLTINVAAVNDAPVGADKTVSFLEDSAYTFATNDFGFSDPNDNPANSLNSVIISTLPASGTLQLMAVDVTVGQEIPAGQLGTLTYTPPSNASGDAVTSFGFKVKDNGGTANGGVDTDTTTRTMTLNVTEVNDPPTATDRGVSILEGGSYTFSAESFGFSDPDDSPPDTLDAVILESLPDVGTLTLSGSAVTVGQVVTAAQIGNLMYTPNVAPGVNVSSMSFKVRDDGGTENGGQNESVAARTLTFSVTDINSAPSGADNTLPVFENDTLTFAVADFGFSDGEDVPPNNLRAIIIDTVPSNGSLTLDGAGVTAGQSILAADVPSLTFTPVADENGDGYASFTFRVQDDGGTEDGGVDSDPTARTITINVQPVNSAPSGADATVDIVEDSAYTFSTDDFVLTDSKDNPANALAAVKIETLPANGSLTLNTVAVSAGDVIGAADIASLEFAPAANQHGDAYGSFTFRVQDDGGTANGGADQAAEANTFTINVGSLNDAPVVQDNTLTLNENTSREFNAADFGFSDPNDTPANNLAAVIIDTLPAAGSLALNEVAVTAGQEIAAADLGSLAFTPVAHANGDAYAGFTFRVKDDGSAGQAGDSNTSVAASTITFNVTAANSAPTGANASRTMLEGGTYTFEVADFPLTDSNDTPANVLAGVRISTLPALGELKLNDTAVTAGQVIALADIPSLTFKPADHGNGDEYTSFTFQVQDDGGTANDGLDLDQSAKSFTFEVTPVNSAPVGTNTTVTLIQDQLHTFSVADFAYRDSNDNPPDALLEMTVVTIPAVGELKREDELVETGAVIPAADIPLLTYTPPAGALGENFASFEFQFRDDGGVENGGIDTDPTPRVLSISIISGANVPAEFSGTNTGAITEDSEAYTVSGQITVVDVDSDPSVVPQTDVAGEYGSFSISSDGNWSYTADNEKLQQLNVDASAVDQFSISTADGSTSSVTINLSGVDDAPTLDVSVSNEQYPDTDGQSGEVISLQAVAVDVDDAISTIEWFVGNEVVASGESASLTLPDGASGILVRATNDKGVSVDQIVSVFVAAPSAPVVSIAGGDRTVTDTDNLAGETVTLSATASVTGGSIEKSEWLIAGEVVASGLTADLDLPDGVTEVTFRATDNVGLETSAAVTITVVAPVRTPEVGILDGDRTVSDTDGIAGESVEVTATATDADGEIVSTQWLLNNEVIGTGLTTTLDLPDGVSVVTFRATDDDDQSSETEVTITVEPAVLPEVSIVGGNRTVEDSDGEPGETVSFEATASDENGEIVSTEWLIGGEVVQQGLAADLVLPDGVSDVTFRATDNDGYTTATAVTVTVVSPIPNEPPSISIEGGDRVVTDTNGLPGETVVITADVSDENGTVSLVEWLLDDTVLATGATVELTLPDGENQLVVRATNNLGSSAESGVTVTVLPASAPTVTIVGGDRTLTDSDSLPGETETFFVQVSDSDGDIVSTRWLLEDGVVATGDVAEIALPDGVSTVSVEATDSQGMTSVATVTVTVREFVPPPSEADVSASTTELQASAADLAAELDQSAANGDEIDDETAARINSMAEKSISSSEGLTQGISAGTVTTGTALNALNTAASTSTVTTRVAQSSGNTQTRDKAVSDTSTVIRNSAAALDTIANRSVSENTQLSDDEQQQVKQASTALLETTGNLTSAVTTPQQLTDLAQSANRIIQAKTKLGVAADEEDVAKVKEVSTQIGTVAVRQALESLGADVNVTDEEVRQILSENDDLLETVFQATLSLPPSVVATQEQTEQALGGAATDQGIDLDEDAARRLAQNTNDTVVRPDNVIVDGMSVLDIIRSLFQAPTTATLLDNSGRVLSVTALEAGEADIVMDNITGTVTVKLPGETYSGVIVSIKSVPSTVPEGIRFRPDGRGMIVNNQVAIEIAPAPVNLLRFAAAVESAGFRFSLRNNGAISLDLGNQQRFSGAFAYDNLDGFDPSTCGAMQFIEPVGPVNSPDYAFGVLCENGIRQHVVPFVDAPDFVASARAGGFTVRTDRSTGIVTIMGEASFKPGFFIEPLTSQERIYHAANKDQFGIAYRAIIRADGKVDYVILSANGAQMMHAIE